MTSITFAFDTRALTKARSLELTLGQGQFRFPKSQLYAPIRAFEQAYRTAYGSCYQFRMRKLLHIAAVKMLEGRIKSMDFQTALFASGGLYLALNQLHPSLAIEKTFGDFTAGFSHQFGVALACMALSEAYKVPWDKMAPIPVGKMKSLDYEIELPDGCWLKFEAKGVSGGSRSSARSSIFKKKQIAQANSLSSNTAMVGVIVQASRELRNNGVIELVDPPFVPNLAARQPENQLAGRYLHYAAIARLAGLEAVAEEYISRIRQLTSSHQFRLRPRSFEPTNRSVASINGRAVVGVQWRLGSGLNPISPNAATQDEVWFYQGMALSRLNQVLENELPELPSFHYNPNNDSATEDDFFDSTEAGVIHSFLPDGSYFGMGAGQLPGLLPISRYELSEPPILGHLG